jgi:hypothetical protein
LYIGRTALQGEPGKSQNSAGEIVIYETKFPDPTVTRIVMGAKMRRVLI